MFPFPYNRFFFAGGCLASDDISDIDVFPMASEPCVWKNKPKPVSSTRNAETFIVEPWPIQICHYIHPTLESLVDSFDFAHVQVGAEIECHGEGDYSVIKIYFTDAFVVANAAGTTWFCGSKYPLSSLMRAEKYAKRGKLKRSVYVRTVLDILREVVKRGFESYDDFKDQLDAVDLGMLPEETEEVERAKLMELYELLYIVPKVKSISEQEKDRPNPNNSSDPSKW